MLGTVRRQTILDRLADRRHLEVAALARELGCSVKTVRRDLQDLERSGRVRRVHGGAVTTVPAEMPPPVLRRADRARRAKDAIAALAAELVPAGGLVFIGAGSTTLALAMRLATLAPRTTFVTNMIDVAQALGHGPHEVHLAGGELDAPTHATRGAEMLRFVEGRLFDLVVFGASAIDPAHGVMGPTAAHAALAEVLRRRGRRCMALADASKFGRTDRYILSGFDDLDVVVSDRTPPAPFPELLAATGVQVVTRRPVGPAPALRERGGGA
jgi:DeoR/GlpR family transcriptional regulator of sugar metabolism